MASGVFNFYDAFSIFAAVLLLMISSFGIFINTLVFFKLLNYHKGYNAFNTLCVVKTIPNAIVCCSFSFWVAPLIFSGVDYNSIPLWVNIIIGQISGFGAYVLGPIIQVFMAANRFYVLFFPIRSMKTSKAAIIQVCITIGVAISIFLTIIGSRESCGFVFDPEVLSWRPEKAVCAQNMALVAFYTILGMSIVSVSLNFATLLKLVSDKASGISQVDSTIRRKRTVTMFIQSVIEDALHLIDMINCTWLFKLYSEIWFQFIFLSLSFLLIHTLDGLVIFCFHPEIHPSWLGKACLKLNGRRILVPTLGLLRTS